MWFRNKHHSDAAGFTLIELVTVLIILGIVGAGITGGMMYAGRVHRAVQVMNQELPQLDTTITLITRLIRENGIGIVHDRLKYHKDPSGAIPAGSLVLDGKVILEHVKGLDTRFEKAFAFENAQGSVIHVTLTLESYSKTGSRNIEFDVLPD